MANVSPVTFDKLTQLRTSPDMRAKLHEMASAMAKSVSDVMREAIEEKHARWRKAAKAR